MNFQKLEGYKKADVQACWCYGLGQIWKVSLLHLSENATFLLTEDLDDRNRKVMRVARTEYHSRDEIEAEMRWIEAWLKGYGTVHSLEERDLLEIPTFIMARRIQLLAWLMSHEDSDPVKALYRDLQEKQ
ncbi:MAG: hypothetical protein HFG49_13005 [Lachnospiraceae bacterium]|jgi:Ser/Thr protein kinase RdoA (MazF antagonist)|nr:hypothetical protein [Lachnospiraceae bacterium]